jgi:hypothetical protein
MQNYRRRPRSQSDTIEVLRDVIYDYNDNINYYNSNMRQIIHMLQDINNTPISTTTTNRNRRNINENRPYVNMNDYMNERHRNEERNLRGLFSNTIRNNLFEDVIVRPTDFQIENAIENFQYDPSGEYLGISNYPVVSTINIVNCPITMDTITPGTIVSRIRHCDHQFSRDALIHWFSYNTRCPICRYDIRNTPILLHQAENQTHIEMNEDDDEEDLNNLNDNSYNTIPTPNTTNTTNSSSSSRNRTLNYSSLLNSSLLNSSSLPNSSLPNSSLPNSSSNSSLPNSSSSNSLPNSWRTITNTLRTFIQHELQNNPTTAELMYTFDLPYFDFSNNSI